jgi:hypothetical protein
MATQAAAAAVVDPKKGSPSEPKSTVSTLAVVNSLLLIFGACSLNNIALEFIIRCVSASASSPSF